MKRARYFSTMLVVVGLALFLGCPDLAAQTCTKDEDRFDNYPLFPNTGDNTGAHVCAQSFVPVIDYTLCKVSVVLSGSTQDTITLRIQNGPGSSATVYTQVSRTGIGAEGWYDFDLPDFDVFSGGEYYIRVLGGAMWRRYQDTSGGDPYPRGAAYLDGVKIDDELPGHSDYWFVNTTYEDVNPGGDPCCDDKEEFFDNYPLFPNSGDNCSVYVCAQSFRPQHDFDLCKVSVVLDTAGGTTATVRIQDGPGASATVFAQGSVSGVTAEGWYDADIPDLALNAGQDYYIRVTGGVLWRRYQDMSGDPYPRGAAYLDETKLDDVLPGHCDYWFVTWSGVAPEICCRYGRVDLGVSADPANVLFVNSSTGDADRVVLASVGAPIAVQMVAPPSGPNPAPFALYVWLGAPTAGTVTPHPKQLGDMCYPTPLTGGTPAPKKIWNNIGRYPQLGYPHYPSTPAPSLVFTKPGGLGSALTATFQGLILDDGSAATKPASITNSVTLVVQ